MSTMSVSTQSKPEECANHKEWNKANIINYNSSYIWERAFYSALFLFPMFSRTYQGENWLSVEGQRGNKDNVYVLFWFCGWGGGVLNFSPATTAQNRIVIPVKVWLLVFSRHRAFNIIVLLGWWEHCEPKDLTTSTFV